MPIYEYQCDKCGTFEVTQRITEKQLGKCPTCKGKVKKLISNTSFQLKGTGWYITDYARKGSGGDNKSESSSKPASESSGESNKSESKKSEPKKTESSAKSGGEKSSPASSSAAS
jgi:putative FmdB family regulatory protein